MIDPAPATAAPSERSRTNDENRALMLALEERFPVDEWRIDGLRIWPLVRCEIHMRGLHLYQSQQAQDAARTPLSRRFDRIASFASSWTRAARAMLADRAVPAAHTFRERPVVLVSDGVSFANLGGKYYERLLDPFAEQLAKHEIPTLMLTLGPSHLVPRHSPSLFAHPFIETADAWAFLGARADRTRRRVELPGFEAAREYMKQSGLRVGTLDADHLVRITRYVRRYEALFARGLARLQPRAVFMVGWYAGLPMAACLAGRKLGIPMIDVQHGAAAESRYWPYVDWIRTPPDGWELMPSAFWVWSRAAAAEIEAWASRANGKHRAIVGGYPMLDLWTRGELSFAREFAARMKEMRERHPERLHVLVTLNGFEPFEKLASMMAVARRAKDTCFWFRTHPCRPQHRAVLREAMAEARIENAVCEEACDWPIYALLHGVDAHATEISSTVLEAEAFGVPTALFHPGEAESYRAVVDRGWARVVDGFSAVPAAAAELAQARANAGGLRRNELESRTGMEQLLELAGVRPVAGDGGRR